MVTIDRDVKFTLKDLDQRQINLLSDGLDSLAKSYSSPFALSKIDELKAIILPHIT